MARSSNATVHANAVLILQICPKILMCGLLGQGQTTDAFCGKTAAEYSLQNVILCYCACAKVRRYKKVFFTLLGKTQLGNPLNKYSNWNGLISNMSA